MQTLLPKWASRCDGPGPVVILICAAVLAVAIPVAAGNPCADCHEDQHQALRSSEHRGVVAEGGAGLCEACHGDGARHLDSGDAADIRGADDLSEWSAEQQSSACLSCHNADFPAYSEVPHSGKVSCWSCHEDEALHTVKKTQNKPSASAHSTWELCTSCHGATRAEFRLQYSHPVEEGLVDCTDCHDVHGSKTQRALERQGHQAVCVECHHEQRGPYLFEHLAMEDGCVSCHRPHGSWNRALLTTTGNGACLTCHLQSNFPGAGNVPHDFRLNGGARCWDCHSEIHGSNTTPDLNPRGRR